MSSFSPNFLVPFLLMLTLLSIFFAIAYPYLSDDALAEKRRSRFVKMNSSKNAGIRMLDPSERRKQIAESLEEIEQRGKVAQRLTLDQRLIQAGLKASKARYYTWANISGIVLAASLFLLTDHSVMIALGYAMGALGLPRLILAFLRRRRMVRFNAHFASAVDVIVRGVRAGLPLGECLRIVARELPEPVCSEFVMIAESQAIGLTMTEAVSRMAERVPLPEVRFFAILIGIQQKSGGNLAESLTNLSGVLRDRKKMAEKIKAMSAEAKASAAIIGALPFCVGFLIHLTSPGYMDVLWTTREGQMMLLFSALWMLTGIFVMKRMISFDP